VVLCIIFLYGKPSPGVPCQYRLVYPRIVARGIPWEKKEGNDGKICTDCWTTTHQTRIFIKWTCKPLQGTSLNFDIPLFEELIDVDAIDKWLNMIEGYFFDPQFF